jgi:hypothetical protein
MSRVCPPSFVVIFLLDWEKNDATLAECNYGHVRQSWLLAHAEHVLYLFQHLPRSYNVTQLSYTTHRMRMCTGG